MCGRIRHLQTAWRDCTLDQLADADYSRDHVTIAVANSFASASLLSMAGRPHDLDFQLSENNGVLSTQADARILLVRQRHWERWWPSDGDQEQSLRHHTRPALRQFCHGVRWVFTEQLSTLFQNNLVEVDGGFATATERRISSAVIANDHKSDYRGFALPHQQRRRLHGDARGGTAYLPTDKHHLAHSAGTAISAVTCPLGYAEVINALQQLHLPLWRGTGIIIPLAPDISAQQCYWSPMLARASLSSGRPRAMTCAVSDGPPCPRVVAATGSNSACESGVARRCRAPDFITRRPPSDSLGVDRQRSSERAHRRRAFLQLARRRLRQTGESRA